MLHYPHLQSRLVHNWNMEGGKPSHHFPNGGLTPTPIFQEKVVMRNKLFRRQVLIESGRIILGLTTTIYYYSFLSKTLNQRKRATFERLIANFKSNGYHSQPLAWVEQIPNFQSFSHYRTQLVAHVRN